MRITAASSQMRITGKPPPWEIPLEITVEDHAITALGGDGVSPHGPRFSIGLFGPDSVLPYRIQLTSTAGYGENQGLALDGVALAQGASVLLPGEWYQGPRLVADEWQVKVARSGESSTNCTPSFTGTFGSFIDIDSPNTPNWGAEFVISAPGGSYLGTWTITFKNVASGEEFVGVWTVRGREPL